MKLLKLAAAIIHNVWINRFDVFLAHCGRWSRAGIALTCSYSLYFSVREGHVKITLAFCLLSQTARIYSISISYKQMSGLAFFTIILKVFVNIILVSNHQMIVNVKADLWFQRHIFYFRHTENVGRPSEPVLHTLKSLISPTTFYLYLKWLFMLLCYD